jgi:hypothetical protein
VSAAPNLLSIVDPFTGTLRQVPLPATAKSMNLSPDGKLAAVLHEGVVSLVDLDNGSLLHSSSTNGAQTEAIVTNVGFVYLLGYTGGWSPGPVVTVINGKTGENVTSTYNLTPNNYYSSGNARGVYSSVNRKAFWTSDSFSEINYFSLDAGGVLTTMGRSPYYSSYSATAPLFLSANEDLIFTGGGTYFRTDTLSYVGTLNLMGINSLSHSAAADEAIAMASSKDYDYSGGYPYTLIHTYESSYHRYTGPLLFADTNIALPVIGGSQSYGMAIFHSANNNHVALVQTGGAKSNAAGLKYYAVVAR